MTAVCRPAAVVAASSHTLSGWKECADAALLAMLRDKFKSGKTEQALELKDTQRLKKHLQQWDTLALSSYRVVFVLFRTLKRGAFVRVFDQRCATPSALQ